MSSGSWPPLSGSVDCRDFFGQSPGTRGYFQGRLTPVVHEESREEGSRIDWFTPKAKFQGFL